jgi:hypothetical protein
MGKVFLALALVAAVSAGILILIFSNVGVTD